MRINPEIYLQKIDLSLNLKSKKEIYMIYLMVFGIIFSISYLFFWDISLKNFNTIKKQITIVQTNINNDNTYLNINSELKLQQLKLDIQKIQTDLAINIDKNSYIKNKIQDISSLLYNEKRWGSYMNSISQSAKKHDVKILTFTNEMALTNKSFGHMLDITLHITGNYKNTIKFINSLEQSELVVDIHGLKIEANHLLNTDLNISVWGINY